MREKLPSRLSSGSQCTVIALSETEVGKLFRPGCSSSIIEEETAAVFANSINSLVVRCITRKVQEELGAEILVFERLYALDYRCFGHSVRVQMLQQFRDQLLQLHGAGFVHGHIQRSSDLYGEEYDNILLTSDALRLVDLGNSVLRAKVSELEYTAFVARELEQLESFSEYFLSR